MDRNKINKHIIAVIERSVASKHRCMFFICGKKARDQVPIFYYQLLKSRTDAGLEKSSVLWTYKREVGITGHHQRKKLKTLRQNYSVCDNTSKEDTFDHFLLSANPQFCHYSETDRVLGQSFSMLVSQDFEALTPNKLARITECVEGGGACIFLLPYPLNYLCNLAIDAHAKCVTESHNDVVPLFHHRLVSTLRSCSSCIVLDDSLSIHMMTKYLDIAAPEQTIPKEIPDYLNSRQTAVFSLCRTEDQLAALKSIHSSFHKKKVIMSLTAARGRGKSAVLGLAVALSIDYGRENVVLTSPHVDNLQTLFAFVVKGLKALEWIEGSHFKVISNDSLSTICISILRNKRKRQVKYFPPVDPCAGSAADLLVIDEAAGIPLPLVKEWMKPEYSVLMASTIQGYEGTGRSLSLKLLNQLRNPLVGKADLQELKMTEAIRYSNGDPIESWLERLLCLEACSCNIFMDRELPLARKCQLYFVNREALFSGDPVPEAFLQQLVSLFVSSHYKNSPDDLLMMADAPAYRLFCLMDPHSLDTPICAIQIVMEGGLSKETCCSEHENSRRGQGDLVPWIVSQQFQEEFFPTQRSARIIRIATHPDCQGMGYGSRALTLLSDFYAAPEKSLPTPCKTRLLWNLTEMPFVQKLFYLGVSFGLTPELLKFWKRNGFLPLYIRQTMSDVTGEHSCVMLKSLHSDCWVKEFFTDFQGRFTALLPTAFKGLSASTVCMVLKNPIDSPTPIGHNNTVPSPEPRLVDERDVARLTAYCRGQVDFHLVLDLMPKLVSLLPLLNSKYGCIIIGIGLQGKCVEKIAEEMNLEPSQVLGFFRKAVSKLLRALEQKKLNEESAVMHYHYMSGFREYVNQVVTSRPRWR